VLVRVIVLEESNTDIRAGIIIIVKYALEKPAWTICENSRIDGSVIVEVHS